MKSCSLHLGLFTLLLFIFAASSVTPVIEAKSSKSLTIPTNDEEDAAVVAEFAKDLTEVFEKHNKKRNAPPIMVVWKDERCQLMSLSEEEIVVQNVEGSKAGESTTLSFDDSVNFIDQVRKLIGADDPQHNLAMALAFFEEGSHYAASRLLHQIENTVKTEKDNIRKLYARHARIEVDEVAEYCGFLVSTKELEKAEEYEDEIHQFKKLYGQIDFDAESEDSSEEVQAAMKIAKSLANKSDICAKLGVMDFLLYNREQRLKTATSYAKKLSSSTVNRLLLEYLQKRRRAAFAIIDDERKWPYPYGRDDKKLRKEVRGHLEIIERIWKSPGYAALEIDPRTTKSISALRHCHDFLQSVDPSNVVSSATFAADIPPLVNGKIKTEDFQEYAIKVEKLKVWYDKVRKFNAKAEKQDRGKEGCPSDVAWELLHRINDFRAMMGRTILKMNYKLFWASQHHCKWCIDENGSKISHDSPGCARGETANERVRHEGFLERAFENMGSSKRSAADVIWGWLLSSAHCRNVFEPKHRVLGPGNEGKIWCLLFATRDEGPENMVSKGGK